MGFLRLVRFVGFAAMMEQIANVVADAAYIVSGIQRLTDCCYAALCGLECGNASGNGEGINSTPT